METTSFKKATIKQWSEADRPREKLLEKGKSALTDAELIAILLGSGSKNETAVELARRILNEFDNDLNHIGKLEVNDLIKFKGIGEAKAISIVAATELGRRRSAFQGKGRLKISSSRDIYNYMAPNLVDLPHEEFWVVLLNKANYLIKPILIGRGGIDGTVADVKLIARKAIEHLASGVILCHNHPSGNLSPSKVDAHLTEKVKEGCRLLDINVLDHVIIAGESYYSFADDKGI